MRLQTEPDTDWKNIFQLWRESGEVLPLKVAKSSWSAEAGHYLIVERVEIKTWPTAMPGDSTIGEAFQVRRTRRSIRRAHTHGRRSSVRDRA